MDGKTDTQQLRMPIKILRGRVQAFVCGYGIISIIFFLILLFTRLSYSPAPLFQDESDGLSRALHWASSGTTYTGQKFPVLIHWTGQFYSFPAYFYPITIWSKFTGSSIAHLRAFSAVLGAISTLLTYALARAFGLRKVFSILASLLFISGPHTLLNYRIAWDPVSLTPLVLIAVLTIENTLGKVSGWNATAFPSRLPIGPSAYLAATGIACSLLWWTYTPGRLISLILIMQFLWRFATTISKGAYRLILLITCVVFFAAGAAPVLSAIAADPSSLIRTRQELNQFTILGIYSTIKSLFSHLTYIDYLLFWGDPQRRHSTGYGGVIGMAGWLIIGTLLFRFCQKNTSQDNNLSSDFLGPKAGIIAVYLIICTLPGALSLPEFQSLRNIAAIPFWCIFSSLLLQQLLTSRHKKLGAKAFLFLAILITVINLFGRGAFQYMIDGKSLFAKLQQSQSYAVQSREYFQYNAYMEQHLLPDQAVMSAVKGLPAIPSTTESRLIFEYYSRNLDKTNGPIQFPPSYAP